MKLSLGLIVALIMVGVHGMPKCRQCPICNQGMRLSCVLKSNHPWASDRPDIFKCIDWALDGQLIGQPEVRQTLRGHLARKLQFPEQPLILHFAGDNGVGKTHAAKLVSIATSMRLSSQVDSGNNLVVVSCSGLKHLSVEFIRSHVVDVVTKHLTTFPSGVVLIDDAQDLPPEAFAALAPLLGSATVFPEAPSTPLNRATIILTSDFGREGRTRGLSSDELKQMIDDEVRASYKYANVKQVTTIPFLPFTMEMAEDMLEHAVVQTSCRSSNVESATVSPEARRAILRKLTESQSIFYGNGRSIYDEVKTLVDNVVSQYVLMNGDDVRVTFHLALNAQGLIVRQITPVDKATATVEL